MSELIYLQNSGLSTLVAIIFLVMFGLPILLIIIGIILRIQKKTKAANVFFILTGIYLLVGLGVCGFMVS